jgi:hypothetical protein
VTLSLGIPFCGGAQFRCIIGPQQAEAFSNNGDAMMNSSSCRYRMGGNICDTEGCSRFWLLIAISALLLFENILRLDAAYQMGACSHYPAWPLDMNNTAEAMVDFQEFIHNWQFDRERCQRSGIITRTEGGGFGNMIKAEKKAAENKAKWQVFKKKKEEDKGKAKDKSKSKRAAAKAEEEDNADNAEDGEEGKKKKSFFGGLFKKKEESSAAEEVDVIKLTEKRLFQEKSSSESENEEEEEASVVASGASGPAGPVVEPFVPTTGTLTIIDLYIVDTIVDVTDGDSRYDRLIAGIFGDVRDQWIRDTVCYFNEQSTYQAHRLFVACAVLNQTLKGCTLRPATVVDMTYACTQHLLTACSAHAAALNADHADDVADPGLSATKFFTPPSFDDSSVLRVLRVVYGSIGTLAPKNSMRVFAGGGVTAPPDEYLVESSGDGGNSRVSHWARGMLF